MSEKPSITRAAEAGDVAGVKAALDAGVKMTIMRDGLCAIHWAAKSGHTEVVKMLLELGNDPLIKCHSSKEYRTPGYFAVEKGHMDILQLLIDHCNENKDKEKIIRHVLKQGVACENVDLIGAAVELGFTEKQLSKYVYKALDCQYDDVPGKSMLEALATCKVATDKIRNEMLRRIIQTCDDDEEEYVVEIAEVIAQHGVDWALLAGYPQVSVLHNAIGRRWTKVIEVFVKNGADVNVKTAKGVSALSYLTASNLFSLLKLFSESGGDVRSAVDEDGDTALHHAAFTKNVENAKIALACGVDVMARNKVEMTPLHTAAQKGHAAMVEILVEQGADPAAKDNKGRTPVELAANDEVRTALFVVAIRSGAPGLSEQDLGLAICGMIKKGDLGAVRDMVEKQHRLDQVFVRESSGVIGTMLHIALHNNARPIVDFLLEAGADVKVADSTGSDPLSRYVSGEAANHLDVDLVGSLVQRGACPAHRNKEGMVLLFHFLLHNKPDPANGDNTFNEVAKYLVGCHAGGARGAHDLFTRCYDGRCAVTCAESDPAAFMSSPLAALAKEDLGLDDTGLARLVAVAWVHYLASLECPDPNSDDDGNETNYFAVGERWLLSNEWLPAVPSNMGVIASSLATVEGALVNGFFGDYEDRDKDMSFIDLKSDKLRCGMVVVGKSGQIYSVPIKAMYAYGSVKKLMKLFHGNGYHIRKWTNYPGISYYERGYFAWWGVAQNDIVEL